MRCHAPMLAAAVAAGLSLAAPAARANYVTGLNPDGDNYLALRTGPGTSYETIRRMGPDTILEVLARRNGWARVRLADGAVGWAFAKYIAKGLPPGATTAPQAKPQAAPEPPAASEPAAPPVPAVVAAAAVAAKTWVTYVGPRYGTSVEYPADVFAMLPPPENADGRSFVLAGGEARFIVFGSNNVFERTAAELMADDQAGGGYDAVTYQRSGADWYVLSGYRGGAVFYRKIVLSADGSVIHTLDIGYPRAAKAAFDPIAARMAKSLRAGPAPAAGSSEATPPPATLQPATPQVAAPAGTGAGQPAPPSSQPAATRPNVRPGAAVATAGRRQEQEPEPTRAAAAKADPEADFRRALAAEMGFVRAQLAPAAE